MKALLCVIALALAFMLLVSTSKADPSCTGWLYQSEGNYWQECVYDDGSRHCFRATDDSGSNQEEISC
jgi:hypothetical protein